MRGQTRAVDTFIDIHSGKGTDFSRYVKSHSKVILHTTIVVDYYFPQNINDNLYSLYSGKCCLASIVI